MNLRSAPGGDTCRAMVSEVSMVKNNLMGHSISLSQPLGGKGGRGGGVGSGLSPLPGTGLGPRGPTCPSAAWSAHKKMNPEIISIFLRLESPRRTHRVCKIQTATSGSQEIQAIFKHRKLKILISNGRLHISGLDSVRVRSQSTDARSYTPALRMRTE